MSINNKPVVGKESVIFIIPNLTLGHNRRVCFEINTANSMTHQKFHVGRVFFVDFSDSYVVIFLIVDPEIVTQVVLISELTYFTFDMSNETILWNEREITYYKTNRIIRD